MYFVYVLQSEVDKNLYYGLTTNLEKRLAEHNAGKVLSTKPRRPFKIVYYEKVESLVRARQKERYFKGGFGRKYIAKKINKALSSIG